MCACRQKKKSFFIEDILQDAKIKPYKNLSQEPTQPLSCSRSSTPANTTNVVRNDKRTDNAPAPKLDEKHVKFNVVCEVQKELELSNMKVNLEQRRNTFPLYPTPLKANLQYPPYRIKNAAVYPVEARHPFSYFSESMLHSDQILRSQLAANGFMPHSFTVRQMYGLDRVTSSASCCGPCWGIGGRRKGGQVRFSATQTGALERRFNAGKYLNPEERRALAATLRLSDRQVKTWFQNRRAKWRRTTPDAADPGSPPSGDDGSDDDVQIAVE